MDVNVTPRVTLVRERFEWPEQSAWFDGLTMSAHLPLILSWSNHWNGLRYQVSEAVKRLERGTKQAWMHHRLRSST